MPLCAGGGDIEDNMLVSLRAQVEGQGRAVMMHQYRDEHGELWINVFDGVFKNGVSAWRNMEPAMGFQRGVVFRHSFGHEPAATASQTPLRREAFFIVDGDAILQDRDDDECGTCGGRDPWVAGNPSDRS